ncbi:MAG TPA: 3-deoxy-8-phosphooctulonate synthase [Deltaproteobacteria bacterium]|jgi:2-dehydro-3-deoxyphosphooctonate aldolase (KDO 8-P synthase)|nr:3-deoxy-8-phosphooctulonate synthase [Deltaproteobacteria bacterium]HOI06748.1 3-deoxy-8-phosphooctulonate synthase [Deltaproteobacteria bacterium]
MQPVNVGPLSIGTGSLVLIAGPCVIESREHTRFMAKSILEITARVGMPFIFKASFDKANRSSISSYRGPGIEEGLDILAGIRADLGVPVTTDIHEPSQAAPAARAVDLLQIPAFLCRQTDILVAAGRTGVPVNVKKGQYMAPWDMEHAVKKVASTGNEGILLTERGASFGYNNLVCDLRSIGIMRSMGRPVVLDVTHSLQLPGGKGDSSGGMSEFIPALARAGVAFGVDALFMEVHDDPAHALSDGPNSLDLRDLEGVLAGLMKIQRALS